MQSRWGVMAVVGATGGEAALRGGVRGVPASWREGPRASRVSSGVGRAKVGLRMSKSGELLQGRAEGIQAGDQSTAKGFSGGVGHCQQGGLKVS